MPNLASRNHPGTSYCFNEAQLGSNFPFATVSAAVLTMTVGVALEVIGVAALDVYWKLTITTNSMPVWMQRLIYFVL